MTIKITTLVSDGKNTIAVVDGVLKTPKVSLGSTDEVSAFQKLFSEAAKLVRLVHPEEMPCRVMQDSRVTMLTNCPEGSSWNSSMASRETRYAANWSGEDRYTLYSRQPAGRESVTSREATRAQAEDFVKFGTLP